MISKFLTVIALLLVFIGSQTTVAGSSICPASMLMIVNSLKLDDLQKKKIKPILALFHNNMKNSMTQIQTLDKQINQQSNLPTMATDIVYELIDQKTQLLGDMIKAKITAKRQIFTVLRPAQQIKLQNKLQKLEEQIADELKRCQQEN